MLMYDVNRDGDTATIEPAEVTALLRTRFGGEWNYHPSSQNDNGDWGDAEWCSDDLTLRLTDDPAMGGEWSMSDGHAAGPWDASCGWTPSEAIDTYIDDLRERIETDRKRLARIEAAGGA